MILDNKLEDEEVLKNIEKEIKTKIEADVEKIKQDPEPTPEDLYTNIGTDKAYYIRGVEYH